MDSSLDGADGDRCPPRQSMCRRQCLVEEPLRRDDAVHEPEGERLIGRGHARLEDRLERTGLPERA